MSKPRNILFVMCDQLRWDYLSCYGHPHLHTPNIDSLAARGVRFDRAYVQSPLCGPSRASIATGRYVSTFGGGSNYDPVSLREKLMGTLLREHGVEPYLIGKLGIRPNRAALATHQIDPDSPLGRNIATGGFNSIMADPGIHGGRINNPNADYNRYLRELDAGYDSEAGWHTNANSAVDTDGNLLSGWALRHAREPANIKEEHSETAYCTNLAIDFLQTVAQGAPWMLQLSYIKPHWPLVAPAPYHALYGPEHVLPAVQQVGEQHNPHPVYEAFMALEYSQTYAQQDVRETVIPTYMGLIKQIDDHFGRILKTLHDTDQFDNTLIVFTSDHGDYLGDHFLGEKDLFHEPSVRVPLIVADPTPAADATRGTTCDRLVELIDLLPTFLDFVGGTLETERLEGTSLLPLLRGDSAENWRTVAISEIDYSDRGVRGHLNLHPYDCRAYMLRTDRWKLIFHKRFRPQLFDLHTDPDETVDLGTGDAHQAIIQNLTNQLLHWLLDLRQRTEIPTEALFTYTPELDEADGIIIGRW